MQTKLSSKSSSRCGYILMQNTSIKKVKVRKWEQTLAKHLANEQADQELFFSLY